MTELSSQQRAVLDALRQGGQLSTLTLRTVRVMYGYSTGPKLLPIGEPVYAVLRRLEKRGLVAGALGSECKVWWVTDAGLAAIGWER